MIEIEAKNKQWLVTRICAKLRLKKFWSAAETNSRKIHDILDVLREIHFEEEAKETYVPPTIQHGPKAKRRKAKAQPETPSSNSGVTD